MDQAYKESFLKKWQKYFAEADLPIAYYYADKVADSDLKDTEDIARCLIDNLTQSR